MSRRSEQIRAAREAARLKAEAEAQQANTQSPVVEPSTGEAMTNPADTADDDRARCGAGRRQGGACSQPAGWGTDHVGVGRCKLHGGSTPNHVKSAGRQMAQAALRALGRPADSADPQAEVLGMVAEAKGNVLTLRQWVDDLGENVTQSVYVAGGYENITKSVLVDLYGEWCDRLVKYSTEALKAGISERVVKVLEEQAEMVARVVLAMLDDPEFGLSWEQRDLGRRIAGRHLRSLPVGA